MIEVSAAGRAGTPDEVGTVGALLMGSDGAFITGSDFLMDGGSYGRLLVRRTRTEMTEIRRCRAERALTMLRHCSSICPERLRFAVFDHV